jgi:hypothetical protein
MVLYSTLPLNVAGFFLCESVLSIPLNESLFENRLKTSGTLRGFGKYIICNGGV